MYSQYYNKIENQKKIFEMLLSRMQSEQNSNKKLLIAQRALFYAGYNNTGYFTSSVLEDFFVNYAKSLKSDIAGIFCKKNSFLHVVTAGYTTGGHTRVVERWIENAPEIQSHSVVFIQPNEHRLSKLIKNVNDKKGKVIYFKNTWSLEDKALKLRKLAMNFEYVILHVHIEDPVPVIAFGTTEFKRPVIFYNHASHMFWIGKSVADLVLDIKENDEVTKIYRNIKNSFFLGVPSLDMKFNFFDKNEYRKKLGLPLDKNIIITSGHSRKYVTIGNDSFADILTQIIDENTYCYVIGVDKNEPEWEKLRQETNGHVILLGYIDFNNGFLDYIRSADLCLDSYPLGGGAALMDAIASSVPVLSLKSVYPQFDYLIQTPAYCSTRTEFIDKVKKVLSDKDYAKNLLKELQISLLKYQSKNAWNEKIKNMLEIIPATHSVKDLSSEKDFCEANDLSVLDNVIVKNNFFTQPVKTDIVKEADDIIKHWVKYKNTYNFLLKIFGPIFLFAIKICKKVNQCKS